MNTGNIQNKLIQAAKNNPPSDHVPYAFEKRIMHRISALPKVDAWSLWGQGLWRAVAPCFAIMVLIFAWSTLVQKPTPAPELVASDFESTVLAPLDGMKDTW
ncbi:MAG TPA: hypothetical protein VK968_10370 [Roseimicrobium sp.]|nr:hypothetical protein [Roseimicrobium sp.]